MSTRNPGRRRALLVASVAALGASLLGLAAPAAAEPAGAAIPSIDGKRTVLRLPPGVEAGPPAKLASPGEPATVHVGAGTSSGGFRAAAATSSFVLEYTGAVPFAVRSAFTTAARAFSEKLTSQVPIHVRVHWTALEPGVLGAAGPWTFYRDFPGAPQAATYYTPALTNAKVGFDVDPDNPDIEAEFSSNAAWATDPTSLPDADEVDLVSTAMHELAHGLGFVSFADYDPGSGLGFLDDDAGRYSAFDRRLVRGSDLVPLTSLPSPSAQLGTAFRSGNLRWNDGTGNGGVRPRMYAPTTWSEGSSVAHLDEDEFAEGNPSSLMTPFLGPGEVIRDLGPVGTAMFAGIGWATAATPAPGAPVDVAALPGNGLASISWGRSSGVVDGYRVTASPGGAFVDVGPHDLSAVITGLTNGQAYTFFVAALNTTGSSVSATATATPSATPAAGEELASAVSTKQYQLVGSNGTDWHVVDQALLTAEVTPDRAVKAVITGNADLWTAKAGVNQDLGIFVTSSDGAYDDHLVAWKESGGFAGTFSPNAAMAMGTLQLSPSVTYTFDLRWKANRPLAGSHIFIGAGSAPDFSPTRLTVSLAAPTAQVAEALSTKQYRLDASDGSTWQPIGTTNDLRTTLTPATAGTATLLANADLWTSAPGFNQDLAIFATAANGDFANRLVAWKESGGFAGTFSPNAAAIAASLPVKANVLYTFELRWKANKAVGGPTAHIGAGSAPTFSPTRLLAIAVPAGAGSAIDATTSSQSIQEGSDGERWRPLQGIALERQVTPVRDGVATILANADLWTATTGVNQDLGIFVSSSDGLLDGHLIAWKESGGFAGTFSPNAAMAQAVLPVDAGVTYRFELRWKSNKPAGGSQIWAGAGSPGAFSPTRMLISL